MKDINRPTNKWDIIAETALNALNLSKKFKTK